MGTRECRKVDRANVEIWRDNTGRRALISTLYIENLSLTKRKKNKHISFRFMLSAWNP